MSKPSFNRANRRTKVVDVELDSEPRCVEGVEGYGALRALVYLHGTPVGQVELPLGGVADPTGAGLRIAILRRLARSVIRHHLRDALEGALPADGLGIEELLATQHPVAPDGDDGRPLITVAVCTRDRAEDLKLCLDSLARLDYPRLDVLVVDNAPTSDATARLVGASYSWVRYVREPKPGLNWARNRAIAEARGEIVAYTDDDVVVDPGWVTALAAAFEDPQVMAVTGLVVPYELETEAQALFERYGGFGRGYERRYWRMDREGGERPFRYLGVGQCGTGANMAYRRGVFGSIGPFDPALDVGTVTNGGGDLEMFFRVLMEGHLMAYEPSAVVRHRHRREYARLRKQISDVGTGSFSYLVRTALAYPEARGDVLWFGLWWFWRWNMRRLARSFLRPADFPRDLIWAEFMGVLTGLGRYPIARRRAAQIAAISGSAPPLSPPSPPEPAATPRGAAATGVRFVDLRRPLRGLDDVASHGYVRAFVALDGRPVGDVGIPNRHRPVSAVQLREALVNGLGLDLLGRALELDHDDRLKLATAALRRRYSAPPDGSASVGLPEDVPVSVVVATYDRPEDLRECLRCLVAQNTTRPVEIVVVDNHPASGLTPPMVAKFPGVVLLDEERRGLSYARNKGFVGSRGEVVVATDDDMLMPEDWLEKLLAPFVQPDVMVVTGNVLPLELETVAQRRFERYGGLGRGVAPKEADSEWFGSFRFRAVPTWELGATANAAFRASIFAHPEIGLLDEALGVGTPTGCSEDTYMFYKVLKAGYTVTYEPAAYAWHRHRRQMRALRKQLYNYSKGHVAYHLTTLLRDRDPRAALELTVRLPKVQLRRIAGYAKRLLLRRQIHYPLGLILTEIAGNLAGPYSLLRSYRRVEREGRSGPCTPDRRIPPKGGLT